MRRFTIALGSAVLSFCFLGLVGCGEDNEAAINAQASKSTGSVDPSKVIPPSKTQMDYFKNNPGTSGAATGSGKTPATSTKGAPADKGAPAEKK
jgi:hypothetical protein